MWPMDHRLLTPALELPAYPNSDSSPTVVAALAAAISFNMELGEEENLQRLLNKKPKANTTTPNLCDSHRSMLGTGCGLLTGWIISLQALPWANCRHLSKSMKCFFVVAHPTKRSGSSQTQVHQACVSSTRRHFVRVD